VDNGKYPEAEEAAKKAIELDDRLYRAYINLGYMHNLTGDYVKAINALKDSLRYIENDKPNEEVIYNNMGFAYGREKKAHKAWKYYRKAYALNEFAVRPWDENNSLREYYVVNNEKKNFMKYYTSPTGNPPELYRKIRTLNWKLRMGDNDTVISRSQEYIDGNPGSIYAYQFIGLQAQALGKVGDHQGVEVQIRELGKSTRDKDYIAWVKYSLAYDSYSAKDYERCTAYLDDIFDNHQDYEKLHSALWLKANIYQNEEKFEEALTTYDEIIEKFPDSKEISGVYIQKSGVCFKLGDYMGLYESYVKSGRRLLILILHNLLSFIISGLLIGFFALAAKFYAKKKAHPSELSGFNMLDLFVFFWLLTLMPHLAQLYVVMPIYYYFNEFFTNAHINPILLASFLNLALLVAVCLLFLKKKYKLDNKTLGFVSRGYKFNILLPIGVTIGSLFITTGFMFLLALLEIKPPTTSV